MRCKWYQQMLLIISGKWLINTEYGQELLKCAVLVYWYPRRSQATKCSSWKIHNMVLQEKDGMDPFLIFQLGFFVLDHVLRWPHICYKNALCITPNIQTYIYIFMLNQIYSVWDSLFMTQKAPWFLAQNSPLCPL